ncbi:hypothetical protein O9992_28775 [Vibrio lentus]|nr:hypothetical protein [Vibrio lentus]
MSLLLSFQISQSLCTNATRNVGIFEELAEKGIAFPDCAFFWTCTSTATTAKRLTQDA